MALQKKMAQVVGSRTLPLLCRKGRRCSNSADVVALIQSYLLIDIGKLDWRRCGLLEEWFFDWVPSFPIQCVESF